MDKGAPDSLRSVQVASKGHCQHVTTAIGIHQHPVRDVRRAARTVSALVVAMALTGANCSAAPSGYGPGAEAAFVAGCAPDHAEPARSVCTCVYQRLAGQIPFERYQEIDRALQHDEREMPDELKQAVDACNRERDSDQSQSAGP